MRTSIECFPCFLKQTVIALGQITEDAEVKEEVLKSVLPLVGSADTSKPPAYTTTLIHRMIRDRLRADPFRKIKCEYNEIALGLYEGLKAKVEKARDPFLTAARLAIAGNIIDFGIFTSVDIDGSINRALGSPLTVDDSASFKHTVAEAENILYLLDNAGEIVFDRLFIELLVSAGKKVRAAVKGSPVLNDATVEDASQAGLAGLCDVIDNGSDCIGTILEWTSSEFRSEFDRAELIISKGQGNFETISGTEKNAYFLFQSKCEVVSRELGLPLGSMILKRS